MSTVTAEVSENAPSVCLLNENPNRLMSLWDIVFLFNAGRYSELISLLQSAETACTFFVRDGIEVNESHSLASRLLLKEVHKYCQQERFDDCAVTADQAWTHLATNPDASLSTIEAELRHVRNALTREGKTRKFVSVDRDKAQYIDVEALFGAEVYKAFPAARADIREAGNCLAVECGTAAVFHLMRSAEVALRILAEDRRVEYPDASLNSKQIGDLLGALDGKMADMRKADAKLWPSKDVKDAQINFYHLALVEFRDFNEAWRKYMAHSHADAFYDSLKAQSIFNHVRGCMQVLSTKLSEASITPLYWTTA